MALSLLQPHLAEMSQCYQAWRDSELLKDYDADPESFRQPLFKIQPHKNMSTNTELERAFNMVRSEYPTFWASVQEEIYGDLITSRRMRISIIDDTNTCYGANGSTPEEALMSVNAAYNKPKDEEISKAIAFLQSHGIQTTQAQ